MATPSKADRITGRVLVAVVVATFAIGGLRWLSANGHHFSVYGWAIIAGIVGAVVLTARNQLQGYKLHCPHCGSSQLLGATVCRKCGRDMP